jgi:far upstream element-binding protein
LEENPDGLGVTENGFQESVENAELQSAENNTQPGDAQEPPAEEAPDIENGNQPSSDDQPKEEIQPSSVEDTLVESSQQQQSGGAEHQELSAEVAQPADIYSEEQRPEAETQTVSRKMEVPNNKVGVLIGKHGETIRFLQINSGAKIQITRDAESDPNSITRPAELIGTLENINKAEKLIKDVIAEADAGGSPSLVARGFGNVHATGAAEQILIQVPNEKVGLIIGKDGETIKNLQTRSGARIQLTPQHPSEGDQSRERTVRVSGDKKQIDMAKEMIKDVMNQTVRSSSLSGGYNQQQQQGFRPRGPAQPQWGHHRGPPHPSQSGGYNYQQRGSYPPPSQHSQYAPPPQAYGGSNYPPQQMGSSRSGSFGSGWEQRHPPSTMLQQGPGGGGGGYDYYGGHMGDVPASNHGHGPSPAPMGPPPPSQGNYNYNYAQPQPAAPPYSSQAPQSYGHGPGYNEAKYDNQAPYHPSYGGGSSQPGPMGGAGYAHPGYAPQDQQYGKAPYAQQHYGGPPRGPQPGDNMPYPTGPVTVQPTQQQYTQNAAPPPQSQQTYPQAYPQPYVSDGYNINQQQQQLQPVATGPAAPVYPQQGPVSGYGQQQAFAGYAQAGPTGGYGSYPTGYTEQPAAQNTAAVAGYGGYQGSVDPAAAYASAPPPTGQAVYAQPTPTQPPTGYDHSGSYGTAPATYGKSASPQPGGYPQYDATGQVIGTHR